MHLSVRVKTSLSWLGDLGMGQSSSVENGYGSYFHNQSKAINECREFLLLGVLPQRVPANTKMGGFLAMLIQIKHPDSWQNTELACFVWSRG